MVESLLFGMLIIAIGVALMSVKVIFKKNGRFASQHIHDNEALKQQGIRCVLDQDKEARSSNKAY
ncbi:MAG: hypothetical protein I3J02_10610 [Prevotella sp.]|nr:hypothetical protein [Prevotella sp.]